jgi:NifU-like protein involved in Fe-S cluster formation
MDRYSVVFLDCFRNTAHAGQLQGAGVICHTYQSQQPFSDLSLCWRIQDSIVEQAAFHASSTPVLIAVAEWVCRWVEGKSIAEINALNSATVQQALDLPAQQVYVVGKVVQLVKEGLLAK